MTWPFENDTGAMSADTHSILLSTGYQKHHADIMTRRWRIDPYYSL